MRLASHVYYSHGEIAAVVCVYIIIYLRTAATDEDGVRVVVGRGVANALAWSGARLLTS